MLGKNKKRIVLIQILVELYREFTYQLGSSFYFLGNKKKKWLAEKESDVGEIKVNYNKTSK